MGDNLPTRLKNAEAERVIQNSQRDLYNDFLNELVKIYINLELDAAKVLKHFIRNVIFFIFDLT